LKTEEGRALYGTQSLRRGAAQALIAAGWSLDDVKFFGRWLSDAIELYVLQVPMRTFGQSLAPSMAGFSLRKMAGADEDDEHPGEFLPVQTLQPALVGLKAVLMLWLPTMLFDSVSEDGVLPISEVAEADCDQYEGTVVASPPKAVSPALLLRRIVYHPSVVSTFPDSYRDFSERVTADQCVLLDLCPSDSSLPLLYVCLLTVKFSVVSGATA